MKLNAIKAGIAPYIVWIQVGVLTAAVGGGVWLGFKLDTDVDCGQLDAETAAELATLRKANASYEALEKARAKEAAEKRDALQRQLAAESRAAQLREADMRKELARAKQEIADAKADPKCAELMELEICKTITIPLAPR